MNPSTKPSLRIVLARRAVVLSAVGGAGVLTPLLARWSDLLPPALAWVLDLAAHWQWVFVGCAVLGAALALPHRGWRAAGLLAIAGVPFLTATAARDTHQTAGVSAFTVASANVHLSNKDPSRLLRWLGETKADVAVVMEVSPEFAAALSDQKAYPFTKVVPSEDPFGIALLSRQPLDDVQVGRLAGGMAYLSAKTDFEGKAVRVVALHTMPPLAPEYYTQRDQDIGNVLEDALTGGVPVVVAGDFNATPWSSGLQEAQRLGFARTTSLAPTWPSALCGLVGIPIDQVLVNSRWLRLTSEVGPDIGSDHYPVLARLALRAP